MLSGCGRGRGGVEPAALPVCDDQLRTSVCVQGVLGESGKFGRYGAGNVFWTFRVSDGGVLDAGLVRRQDEEYVE